MITNYMIIGYGWRADFYYRIAKLLPERFSVCAGVLRTEERAKEVAHKEGVFATSDLDQALERKPDFAVLCVPRDVTKDYLVKLMKKGIPVLCETPPGKNVEELKELWEMSQKYNGRIQIEKGKNSGQKLPLQMAEMVLMKAEQSLKRTETGHIWSLKTEKQPLWTLKVNSTFHRSVRVDGIFVVYVVKSMTTLYDF